MISWITDNWGYKLFALVLSAALWTVLVKEQEVADSFAVPVQYRNIPRDLEILSSVSDRVHLEVRGPSGKLTPAQFADTAVMLDLAGVNRPGERTFPIETGTLTLPSGARLQRAAPAQIRLVFEKRLLREVPVKIRIGMPPPGGYEIGSQVAEPEYLRIAGPESRVRNVDALETDSLDLSDTVATEEFRVHAFAGDPQVRIDGDSRVRVRISVRKSAAGGTK